MQLTCYEHTKVSKINTDQAEQRRYYFKRYLVIQDCTHRNHTKAGHEDDLPADGDLCWYHYKTLSIGLGHDLHLMWPSRDRTAGENDKGQQKGHDPINRWQ